MTHLIPCMLTQQIHNFDLEKEKKPKEHLNNGMAPKTFRLLQKMHTRLFMLLVLLPPTLHLYFQFFTPWSQCQ
jgi:hypothetical protein